MTAKINQTTWYGQEAWTLESDTMRVAVVPGMGAKLVSLFDKRSHHEWLVGPGERPFQPVPYGAEFTEQDMSGWDEMFPTIVACDYPAAGANHAKRLPDHGEVWSLPWQREEAPPEALCFSVEGIALDYRLTRTLSLSGGGAVLHMAYELVNHTDGLMPYLWAAHPQFRTYDEGRIVLPPAVTAVANVLPADWGWGDVEAPWQWPVDGRAVAQDGRLDWVGSADRQLARKFLVPPSTAANWAGLISKPSNNWLRMEWNSVDVPYLGVWIDEGYFSQSAVAALEPMTGYYDSLETAWNRERVALLKPRSRTQWMLTVILGTAAETAALFAQPRET